MHSRVAHDPGHASSNMPVATRNAMAMAQREGKALGEEGAFYKDTIAITTQGKRETCPK